jgi:hypothetical protein
LVWGSQGLLMGLQRPETPKYSKISLKWVRLYLVTLKPQYNDPFNNKISAIKNLISSPFVVNFIVTRTSNGYQAQSNFDVTSFRHQLISSSFSSSRSNCNITSFPRNFIVGTDGTTNQPTNRPTNIV